MRDREDEGRENVPETDGAAESAEIPAGSQEEETFTFTRDQVEKMEAAVRELDAQKDQFLRLAAEYDNYRKRTVREKEDLYQSAKADAVRALLPVYDDLERAAAQPGDDASPHKKGLVMIFQKYRELLKSLGVEEMDPLGKPFDPEKHEAVMHIEDPEKGEGEVSQVFQAGFEMGGKVLRHATVQVAN